MCSNTVIQATLGIESNGILFEPDAEVMFLQPR